MNIWFNGKCADAASVPGYNAGTLLGWGVYTTIGIWGGLPFALDLHLARLRRDAGRAEVPLTVGDDELAAGLAAIVSINNVGDGIARITATRRGDGRWINAEGSDVTIAAMAIAAAKIEPLKLAVSPFRLEARRALAGVKATSYLDHLLAGRAAMARGFDDALICNGSGALCECSRANIFWVSGGILYTPAVECGPLPGIGRGLVLQWAHELGIAIRQGAFSPQELQKAEEVFTTSSVVGPRAVSLVELQDDMQTTHAPTGEITQLLSKRWHAAVRSNQS